jgi:hypothetical protein
MSDEKAAAPGPRPERHRRRKPSQQGGDATKAANAAPAKPEQTSGQAPPAKRERDRDRPPRKGDRNRDGNRRDGKRPEKAPPVIRSTEVTVDRGADYVISKRTEFDANTHKPVAVRYKLTRVGLPEPQTHSRLADAREAAKMPIEAPAETTEPTAAEPAAEATVVENE